MDRPKRRKLLVASVGVASISYVVAACGKDQRPVSGNLPAPPPTETTPIAGNLPAPEPIDAGLLPQPDSGPTAPAPKKDAGK